MRRSADNDVDCDEAASMASLFAAHCAFGTTLQSLLARF